MDLLTGDAELFGNPGDGLAAAQLDEGATTDGGQPADRPAVLVHEAGGVLDAEHQIVRIE